MSLGQLYKLYNVVLLIKLKEDIMAITTTTILPAPVQQSFSFKLLSVEVPNMIFKIPAMKKNMPRNGGTTLRMRRYNPLATAMVPLGNTGVTPPAQQLTAVDMDAKISWYGTHVILNEQCILQSQDPVLNECAARLGVSLRQTEDQLTRDMLAATAGFINCVGGVNGRIVAVVKSFLMGLKLLTGNAEDNKAQASLGCAA